MADKVLQQGLGYTIAQPDHVSTSVPYGRSEIEAWSAFDDAATTGAIRATIQCTA
jgi:hypothetical protein